MSNLGKLLAGAVIIGGTVAIVGSSSSSSLSGKKNRPDRTPDRSPPPPSMPPPLPTWTGATQLPPIPPTQPGQPSGPPKAIDRIGGASYSGFIQSSSWTAFGPGEAFSPQTKWLQGRLFAMVMVGGDDPYGTRWDWIGRWNAGAKVVQEWTTQLVRPIPGMGQLREVPDGQGGTFAALAARMRASIKSILTIEYRRSPSLYATNFKLVQEWRTSSKEDPPGIDGQIDVPPTDESEKPLP